MKKAIIIAIVLCLIPALCLAGGMQDRVKQVISAKNRVDVTAPTFASASIDTTGLVLTVNFSEAVTEGAGYDDGDWTLACSTTTPTTIAHNGGTASAWLFDITGGPVLEDGTDTCTLDWAGTANGVEDSVGNDLAAFDPPKAITNGSTEEGEGACDTPISPNGLAAGEDIYIPFGYNGTYTYAGFYFTLAAEKTVCAVTFSLSQTSGNISGKTYVAKLWAMSSYDLTGSPLATSTGIAGNTGETWNKTHVTFSFPSPATLSASTQYAVTIDNGTIDDTNNASIGVSSSSSIANWSWGIWATDLHNLNASGNDPYGALYE